MKSGTYVPGNRLSCTVLFQATGHEVKQMATGTLRPRHCVRFFGLRPRPPPRSKETETDKSRGLICGRLHPTLINVAKNTSENPIAEYF